MDNDLYFNILKKLYEHMIGGVATPLGSGPSGDVDYNAKKAYRNKSKKRKKIQTVLKSN